MAELLLECDSLVAIHQLLHAPASSDVDSDERDSSCIESLQSEAMTPEDRDLPRSRNSPPDISGNKLNTNS
jgi:hypothetical protein